MEGQGREEINKRRDEEKERGANNKQIIKELKLTHTNESPEGFSYDKIQKFTAFKLNSGETERGTTVLRTVTEK